MDRAWLAQVETEAVAYFVGGANVHTAVAVNYADGPTYIAALRAQFATLAAATLYGPTAGNPGREGIHRRGRVERHHRPHPAALRSASQRAGRILGRLLVNGQCKACRYTRART